MLAAVGKLGKAFGTLNLEKLPCRIRRDHSQRLQPAGEYQQTTMPGERHDP